MTFALLAILAISCLIKMGFAETTPQGGGLADRIKAGIDAMFGTAPAATTSAAPQVPGFTLRHNTLSKFLPLAGNEGKNLGDLIDDNAQDLGDVELGERTTIRDTHATDGGVRSEDDIPQSGRTYVVSVRKEDKGN